MRVDEFTPPVGRVAGCLPRITLLGDRFEVFEDRITPIPRSRWKGLIEGLEDLSQLVSVIHDQGQEGSCFPAGIRILMSDGTPVPIEKIEPRAFVRTPLGNCKRVTETMIRWEAEKLLCLFTEGYPQVKMTANHPVLTRRGYIPAEKLTADDDVVRSSRSDDAVWVKVQGVEYEPFKGSVYNMEVEDDHSYVAEGIAVHNCASNAAAQCAEIVWSHIYGKDAFVQLSPMSLYRRVASSAQSGSTLDGNIDELAKRGILPVDNAENKERFGHTHPSTGWNVTLPGGWEETARLFRAVEWFDVASFDGMVTALLSNYPVCYGRAGHAICGVAVRVDGGRYVVKYANSWGDWGEDGFGYDSEAAISGAIRSYGAWALRYVTMPDEMPVPKKGE